MAFIRLVVGAANVFAAYLMWQSASIKTSTAINGVLGAVLPLVFMLIMAIGVSGLALKVSPGKIVMIVVGTALIIWGTR
jgi:hypothetical protein